MENRPRYRVVAKRAAHRAWCAVIAHSWQALGVKLASVLLILVLAFGYTYLTTADDGELFSDELTLALLALAGAFILVFGVFLAQLLFVAPFQLWREQWDRADFAETALAKLQGQIAAEGPATDWLQLPKALRFAEFGSEDGGDCDSSETIVRLNRAADKFQQLHHDGHLRIRGNPDRHVHVYTDLPRDIWAEQQIARLSIFERKAKTEHLRATGSHPVFYRLIARKSEIEGLFHQRGTNA